MQLSKLIPKIRVLKIPVFSLGINFSFGGLIYFAVDLDLGPFEISLIWWKKGEE